MNDMMFESIKLDNEEIVKLFVSSIKTVKKNNEKSDTIKQRKVIGNDGFSLVNGRG